MKKLLPLLLLASSPAFADIKQEFVTSAQITVALCRVDCAFIAVFISMENPKRGIV